jgi:hypothetical protein
LRANLNSDFEDLEQADVLSDQQVKIRESSFVEVEMIMGNLLICKEKEMFSTPISN